MIRNVEAGKPFVVAKRGNLVFVADSGPRMPPAWILPLDELHGVSVLDVIAKACAFELRRPSEPASQVPSCA